jgi:hypothetical protein
MGQLGEPNRPPGLIPVKMIPSDPEPAPTVELKTSTGVQPRIAGSWRRQALQRASRTSLHGATAIFEPVDVASAASVKTIVPKVLHRLGPPRCVAE